MAPEGYSSIWSDSRTASGGLYGERSGTVRDPFGHERNVGHSLEELSPEEMQRRYTRLMTKD
jgi:PhnB protein